MRTALITLATAGTALLRTTCAQPTITQASAPVPGPPVVYYTSYDPLSIPIGGPVVFDLSGLTTVGESEWTSVSPVGQPGSSNFPDATVVRVNEGGTFFDYVSGGPNGFERLGFYLPSPPTLYACSDPIRDLPYPATYGTAWSDSYTCTGTSGQRDWLADGYGELQLPMGALSDVLMTSMQQTSDVDTLPGGVLAWTASDVHHFWHASSGFPVATVVVTVWYEDGIEVSVTYSADYILGDPLSPVEDLTHTRRLLISPNPSDGLVTLGGDPLREVVILDVNGRTMHASGAALNTNASRDLDLRAMPSGVYVIKATTKTGAVVQGRLVLY